MPRNWGASALARAARTAPNWDAAPDYADLAAGWGDWASGATVDSRVVLVSGSRLGVLAPMLMPYPRPGWGFVSASGTIVGSLDEPNESPVVTAAGTALLESTTMLDRISITASGTFARVLDSRTTSVLRPSFAQSV